MNNLFADVFPESGAVVNDKYTNKIKSPVYEPSGNKPNIFELVDTYKAVRLIAEIQKSTVSDEEKLFLIEAAKRHNVFHYERIADYYARTSPEMQNLMENSALVIVDFKKAIEHGYIKLTTEVIHQYLDKQENEQ